MQKLLTAYVKTILSLILLLSISITRSSGQTDPFIRVAPTDGIPDNADMSAYKLRLRKNPNLARYDFIKLNPLAESQRDGILALDIPGKQNPIIAEASHVEYQSETDYEWIGKTDEDRGTVIIISKAGRVCAHISTPEGVYEIFPAPGGLYCLQEIDMTAAGDVGCVTTGGGRSGGRMNAGATETHYEDDIKSQSNAKMQPCQPLVNPRVLVLYTPNALALAGSIQAISDQANLSIAQFNSCIYNSGITSNAVLTLAGVVLLNFIEKDNSMTQDVTDLPGNVSAQNLRNQYQADLIVLYTNGGYGARGATAEPFNNNSTAYSIVQILNSVTNKTFAHEVGHIYGCRHDNESGNPQYAQGYNIKNGLGIVIDRTVMSNNTNDGSNRLLNFSNPNISVGGKPTGTNADNNNSKRVGETHIGVGNFRPNPNPPFVAYLDGPTYVTTQGGKNYELTYSCGNAPYSFVWEYSYDGINYTTSNITTDIFTWYFYQNQKIYLKGTVVGNGQATTAFIAITAQMPSPYKKGVLEENSIGFDNTTLNAAPNPGSKLMHISYNLKTEAQVRLEIANQAGQIVATLVLDEKETKGFHSHEWITNNIATGSYFIHLKAGQFQESKQVVVSH
ncbi:MAG: M12 family metallo-peptidase [Dyadobacter sp.]|uniref:M12 family metallo-peptidase n=1 Tax=Dyadobacter sp. TaxID=1914288 RepID=UPI003266B467